PVEGRAVRKVFIDAVSAAARCPDIPCRVDGETTSRGDCTKGANGWTSGGRHFYESVVGACAIVEPYVAGSVDCNGLCRSENGCVVGVGAGTGGRIRDPDGPIKRLCC